MDYKKNLAKIPEPHSFVGICRRTYNARIKRFHYSLKEKNVIKSGIIPPLFESPTKSHYGILGPSSLSDLAALLQPCKKKVGLVS